MLTMTCDKCGVGISTADGRKYNGRHRLKFGDGQELVTDLCETCSANLREQIRRWQVGADDHCCPRRIAQPQSDQQMLEREMNE